MNVMHYLINKKASLIVLEYGFALSAVMQTERLRMILLTTIKNTSALNAVATWKISGVSMNTRMIGHVLLVELICITIILLKNTALLKTRKKSRDLSVQTVVIL